MRSMAVSEWCFIGGKGAVDVADGGSGSVRKRKCTSS